jgi:predicted MPP superfamily phosphohydrolase
MRPWWQMLIFLAVVTLVIGGVHFYLWSRLVRAAAWSPGITRGLGIAFAVMALLTPIAIGFSRTLPRSIGQVVAYVAYVWFGFVILMFFTTAASEALRLLLHVADLARGAPDDPARRTFLARVLSGGIVGIAAIAGISGLAAALGEVGVKRVAIKLSRWPAALAGFRIAQLTDVHIGPTIGGTWLREVVRRTNELEADIVVITGDLVDGSVAELREHTAALAELRAKRGVYFVTGNHEYYSGVDEWLDELVRLGIRPLRNERVSIGDGDDAFDLAGVDDWSTRRGNIPGHGADLKKALAGRDPGRAVVLLAHQPIQATEAADLDVGLQLSGHTHGGQIFPWGFLVKLQQGFVAGLDRLGATQIYTSCGTGYWGPPMRVGAPSEIALLEIGPE